MVDTCVSGAYGEIRGGSSPPFGTKKDCVVFFAILHSLFSFLLSGGLAQEFFML